MAAKERVKVRQVSKQARTRSMTIMRLALSTAGAARILSIRTEALLCSYPAAITFVFKKLECVGQNNYSTTFYPVPILLPCYVYL